MAIRGLFLLSSITLAAVANPISTSRLVRRQFWADWELDDYSNHDSICRPHAVDTPDNSLRSWTETSAGDWMDLMLRPEVFGTDIWADRLYEKYIGADAAMDCGSIDGQCAPSTNCTAYFEAGVPVLYWVMRAVQGCQSVFRHMKQKLVDRTIIAGLKIDEIVTDFDFTTSEGGDPAEVFGGLAAAFTIAAGVLAWNPVFAPIVAVFTAAAGAMSAAALAPSATPPEDNIAVQLNSAVVGMFETANTNLADTLRLALTGKGDIPLSDLPGQGTQLGGDPYRSPIAAFFADGRYLFDSVNDVLEDLMQESQTHMIQWLVIRAVRSHPNFIFIDIDKTAETCNEKGMIWQNNHCFCMNTVVETPDGIGPVRSEEAKFDLMVHKYGINLGEMYLNACQCKKGSVDEKASVDNGRRVATRSLPRCFFRLNCIAGRLVRDSRAGPEIRRIDQVDISDEMI